MTLELPPTAQATPTLSALARQLIAEAERKHGRVADSTQKEELTQQIKGLLYARLLKNCYAPMVLKWLGLDPQTIEFNASFIFNYGVNENGKGAAAWRNAMSYKELIAATTATGNELFAEGAYPQQKFIFLEEHKKDGQIIDAINISRTILAEIETRHGAISDNARRLAVHYSIKDMIYAKLLAAFYMPEDAAVLGVDMVSGEQAILEALRSGGVFEGTDLAVQFAISEMNRMLAPILG